MPRLALFLAVIALLLIMGLVPAVALWSDLVGDFGRDRAGEIAIGGLVLIAVLWFAYARR